MAKESLNSKHLSLPAWQQVTTFDVNTFQVVLFSRLAQGARRLHVPIHQGSVCL
jgi:hypothetical protein